MSCINKIKLIKISIDLLGLEQIFGSIGCLVKYKIGSLLVLAKLYKLYIIKSSSKFKWFYFISNLSKISGFQLTPLIISIEIKRICSMIIVFYHHVKIQMIFNFFCVEWNSNLNLLLNK